MEVKETVAFEVLMKDVNETHTITRTARESRCQVRSSRISTRWLFGRMEIVSREVVMSRNRGRGDGRELICRCERAGATVGRRRWSGGLLFLGERGGSVRNGGAEP